MQDIKVLRGLGEGIDEAVILALKNCKALHPIKPYTNYILPVSFDLVSANGEKIPDNAIYNNIPVTQNGQLVLNEIHIIAQSAAK